MKKKMFLPAILFFVFACSMTVFAAYDGVAYRISQLAGKFPDGRYWDHGASAAGYDAYARKDESWMDSVTSSPCTHYPSYAGCTDCNYFDGGSQCWGFANRLYYEVFGVRCSNAKMSASCR